MVNRCSLCFHAKDKTITINPQPGNGAGVWMTSCPEEMVLRIWGFWKRVSWDWTSEARIGYSAVGSWRLKDAVGFFGSLPTEILDITRYAARWSGVSIVWLVLTFVGNKRFLSSHYMDDGCWNCGTVRWRWAYDTQMTWILALCAIQIHRGRVIY